MKHTLLIGEDEPSLQEVLAYVAGKLGIKYYTECDGDRVFEQALKIKPDMMLLDIYMPSKNGIEVCKLLKNSPETKDIYIVMMTASEKVCDKEDALTAGADEFMTKPFSPKVLLGRLSNILDEKIIKKHQQVMTRMINQSD